MTYSRMEVTVIGRGRGIPDNQTEMIPMAALGFGEIPRRLITNLGKFRVTCRALMLGLSATYVCPTCEMTRGPGHALYHYNVRCCDN